VPQDHQLQAQRFELKYLVPEQLSPSIRSFLRSYLELDEFAAQSPNHSYQIHSIYLDSEDLKTYHWTLNGNDDRYKLRIRYYDGRDDSPVFFETKRRLNDCILKERCAVHRRAAHLVLRGHLPDKTAIMSNTVRHLMNLQRFCYFATVLQAKPKAHVAYAREAWVSTHDNSMRITMDRKVSTEPMSQLRFCGQLHNPFAVFGQEVVLEIKFTERFPSWCRDMVEALGLAQTGAAKYVWGIEQLGEARFAQRDWKFREDNTSDAEPAGDKQAASTVRQEATPPLAHAA
jgi:SPX domain protein involved in polyphosphate accumulation